MPLFTFVCGLCGREREIILKHAERDGYTEPCLETPWEGDAPPEQRVPCAGTMHWRGVEGSQAVRMNGKYQFQLKDSKGQVILRKPPDRGF